MSNRLTKILGIVALVAVAASAQASPVYSNNFDAENNGKSAKDYTGFKGLTVTYPSVDLVHTGDGSGISCAGDGGGCVNLDGGEPGQLVSDVFNFKLGDVLTWTFKTSGSQQPDSPLDTTYYAFRFNQATGGLFTFVSSSGLVYSDAYGASQNGFDPATYDVGLAVTAPYNYAFSTVTFTFTPTNAGSFRFLFDAYNGDGTDFDGAGRVVDDVALDITSVPEPATWAMMIGGFGLLGFSLRWRSVAAMDVGSNGRFVPA